MNASLLAYIRELSQRDRKPLAQKALKTTEEVGELAKKVLPFENAHATTHRFVAKRDILEECVDTVLCALSVAYDLGFEDEDIEDMMQLKAEKWARLQAREEGVKFPLPFELHVTVREARSPEAFRADCKDLDVKPIFLDLQDTGSATVLHDVMTSSVHFGDNQSVLRELERIDAGLLAKGYEVLRRKIETVPWHPAAPSRTNGVNQMPPGGYFESHVNILVAVNEGAGSTAALDALGTVARQHGAHLSRSVFKRLSAQSFTVMTTLRGYEGDREDFEQRRDALGQALELAGFQVSKLITEFSLYDSRTGHDSSWLKSA